MAINASICHKACGIRRISWSIFFDHLVTPLSPDSLINQLFRPGLIPAVWITKDRQSKNKQKLPYFWTILILTYTDWLNLASQCMIGAGSVNMKEAQQMPHSSLKSINYSYAYVSWNFKRSLQASPRPTS